MVNKNAEKLYRDVKKYPVMLYIGKSITNDEVLLLKDLGWSGVITSRTDDAFSDLWSREEIRLRDILPNSDTNVTAIIDEKDLLPIVRLFGIDGEEYISEDDIYSADDYAESMFQKASSCLDSVHKLVVAGYDSQADGELNFKSLIKSLTNAPNCSIQFWGCCVNNNEKVFRGFCGRKRHLIEPASLPGSLCEYIDYLEEANEDEVVEDVFFCDGKEIQYNKRAFGRQSGLYTLLTANTISGFKPVGEEITSEKEKEESKLLSVREKLKAMDGFAEKQKKDLFDIFFDQLNKGLEELASSGNYHTLLPQDFLQEHIAIHFNNVPLPVIA